MAEKKQRELTPFEQELKKAIAKVREYKTIAEANIVSLFWKNQDLLYSYSNIKLEDLSENMWKVYWQVAHDIVIKERKVLDEITVNFYLEKHPKLKLKFEEYGGYSKIVDTGDYIREENLHGYVLELQKWNVVLNMLKNKFPVESRINEFVDLTVEQIYDEYSLMLNHIFANAETQIKSYSLSDGLDELIEKLDEGIMIGLDYYHMPMLNHEIGGRLCGSLDLIGAVSNLGKSTIARSLCIPSAIEKKEPLTIIINEESVDKTKSEMLIWVSNIIFKQDVQKYIVRDGKFTDETRAILKKSAQWLRDNADDGLIRIIPFQRYTVELAMKVIAKYAHAGCKYFIIDTMKLNANSNGEAAWLDLQQSSVKLYDLIKPENLNVHVLFTYQLGKAAVKQKYLSQDSLGMSKSVIDVCSSAILVRALHQDEFEGGKNELKVYRLDGKSGKTRIPVRLDKDKIYHIFFISKNRAGSTSYQIVVEADMSRNRFTEVGICTVIQDW